ncbi:zinc finger BED domain-containing protein RICESLEEPER 3-like, partial [Pseudomyrmex gracilis]|uniref:zinc finger BED domain-containing protein RICESLEEPER 3-like n=1 Tax=Pseudomyrmex gracilis TaxID=219809 RepID=UPI000995D19D
MKQLKRRHTAENLKNEIETVLQEFDIKKNQIYSITTDNGRNILKAVELISDENDVEVDEERERFSNESYDNNNEQCVDDVIQNFCNEYQNIISVKCAAHTLQLAVKDYLAENKIELIHHARQVVKTLRTSTFRYTLQHLHLRKPQMDVPTRWNSTYQMLERLLEHKDFCKENLKGPLALTEEEWNEIQELISILKPLSKTTLTMQTEQLFFGDFYKHWLNLKIQLQSMASETANTILAKLKSRESQLLDNDALNAAIFLDPRLKRLLSTEKKTEAKKHLKKVAAHMLSIKQNDSQINQNQQKGICNDSLENSGTTSTNNSASLLEHSIRMMEVDVSSSDDESEITSYPEIIKAYSEIENYKEKRININQNIVEYWRKQKYKLPYLSKLALIIHAVPATQ